VQANPTSAAARVPVLGRRPAQRAAEAAPGLGRALLLLVTVGWSAGALASFAAVGPAIPHAQMVVAAYPLALIAILLLVDVPAWRRDLVAAAIWASAIAAAYLLVPRAIAHPDLGLASLAVVASAAACWRFPVAALSLALLAAAAQASVLAFTGFDVVRLVDLILIGLWVGLLVRVAIGARDRAVVLWPAVVACLGYIAITAVFAFTSENGLGELSFRASTWWMLAFLLVAYAGFDERTRRRLVQAVVATTALVAGYAVLRWLIGPADEEAAQAYEAAQGLNVINGHLRLVGSFLTGHQLAFWAGVMAPFCLAIALVSRGRWRVLAAIAVVLCAFASFGSEARGPLAGMVVGAATVLVVYQLSVGLGRARTAVTVLAVSAVALVGGVAYAVTIDDPNGRARYEQITDPTSDPAFAVRVVKWESAIAELEGHPFGFGLGSAGQLHEQAGRYQTVASQNLDNSYIKVAYEQGLIVLAYFIVTLLALLASIAVGAARTRDRGISGPAIGAAGALAAMMVSFYTGLYIEGLPAVCAWIVIGLGLAGLVTRPKPGPSARATG
jgi:uncharacterized membrane protein YhaH (DUF805 family)